MSLAASPATPQRLLIFVITYRAEKTLTWVLSRIPRAILQAYDCEVLVVDDASTDGTFEIGHEWKREHPEIRMTVLRNDYNQGYGGNQKVGYTYAIENGFDFVAMIHGDGQYAPEELPRLMEPLATGRADAVLGSRMMEKGAARKGGMPLYKYVGNRILTRLQNLLLQAKLSEYHCGYRLFAVPILKALPFRLNTNDFHFDTEIIIQLLNGGFRIVELPIPTYYGDEICYVHGLRYAKEVMHATLRNTAHRAGLLYQRRFDVGAADNRHYDLKLGYPSSHSWALAAVPPCASVIDIGAGPGGMARELARKGCTVAVVDEFSPDLPVENVRVFRQNLDAPLGFDVGPYKYLLLLDVIEHLRAPEDFLERLRKQFTHEPKTLVLTTANVAFVIQRLMLLAGQFNYGKLGILDRTHTRLLTFRSTRHMLRDHGFRIKTLRGVPAPFPKVLGNGPLGHAAVKANLALIRLSKTLFSYQIYVEAETTPDVTFVLQDTQKKSAERAPKLQIARGSGTGSQG
ncbi:MAG: glycosyltransferase [Deltaproteobacteria bacterium]|nr:glycosyltransferase [Deltaproteobacteria bacterium]